MKIWLVNPPENQSKSTGIFSIIQNLFYNSPPLGLAYLGAVLEKSGHKVMITDSPVEKVYLNNLPRIAKNFSPDLIGLTSTTTFFAQALAGARLLKKELPNTPICIGGPHLNANKEMLLDYDCFDYGVIGEGENTLVEIADNLEQNKNTDNIPGTVSVQNGELHFAPPRSLIEDLDDLPFPARHLLPIDKYRPMPNDQYRLPKTSMITSRGCPFKCIFCDKSTFGGSYRAMSAKKVVDEMHLLKKDFGINEVAFVDSTFTPNKKQISQFLDEIEKRPLDMTWTCSCRANVLNRELAKRLKAAKCWRIRIGIESGNREILQKIRKGISKEQFAESVRIADEAGLQVKSFFMVGHIGETPKSIKESIQFAKSIPLKDITVQINTPLKGAPQFDDCKKHGEILSNDLSKYTFFQPVFIPKGFTAKEIVDYQKKFYRSFYLRPSLIWRHIKAIRSFSDITKYIRALPLVINVLFYRKSIG